MRICGHIKTTPVIIAAILALFVVAATPSKDKTEAPVIRISEIDRDSVRVVPPKGEGTARLSFLFRNTDAHEAGSIVKKARRVRITDGATIVTETKLAGIIQHDVSGKRRSGLVLLFDSVEEANRVAAVLRPI